MKTESQLKQDLRAVRAHFSGPEKWVKGAYARDAHGKRVSFNSKSACRWCLSGAIYGYCVDKWATANFLIAINGSIVTWNDAPDRTFEDVIALLDKAIEAAP